MLVVPSLLSTILLLDIQQGSGIVRCDFQEGLCCLTGLSTTLLPVAKSGYRDFQEVSETILGQAQSIPYCARIWLTYESNLLFLKVFFTTEVRAGFFDACAEVVEQFVIHGTSSVV